MARWTDFGVRHNPPMSGRTVVTEIAPPLIPFVDERVALRGSPFLGITTDGNPRRGLFELKPTGKSLTPLAEAASAFLDGLTSEQRARAQQPLESEDWRAWINVHMNFFRHGVMLEDLDLAGRQRALDLLRATLSARGFGQARDIMRLNELLRDVTASPDEFGEWLYFVTVFDNPSSDEPWGWQIDGHHLVVNCVVVGDQMVLTPTFMESEPRAADARQHDERSAPTARCRRGRTPGVSASGDRLRSRRHARPRA